MPRPIPQGIVEWEGTALRRPCVKPTVVNMEGGVEGRDWLMTTQRLGFGIWRDADAALANAIWGDAEVTKLTGGPFTAEAVTERLTVEIDNWRLHGVQYWPVFRLDDSTLVGCCGLRPRNMDALVVELGFQLCRDAWGRGFATEAGRRVIEWARKQAFASLIAGHHPENQASRRALLGLGFLYSHDELYPPTGQMEPCYLLRMDGVGV